MKFDFYADPGHGWMKVPLSLIKKLGVQKNISTYSYVRNAHAFLEEDRDAGVVIKALREQGREVGFREHVADKRSKIRSYACYDARQIDWDKH